MKNIIIYTISDFNFNCGGLVVQYELARNLYNLGVDVKIIVPNKIFNPIFNNFYKGEPINYENTVVFYSEGIEGNPLNAKHVVRWLLAPLGLCSDPNVYKTYGKNDLVYYFHPEDKFINEAEKVGNIYKLLNLIYVNPLAQNNNLGKRIGTCYTLRKSHYHKKLQLVHPPNSFNVDSHSSQLELISHFNKYKYFISYDPLTFISVIAALCGCISIVKKVDGMSKDEWLKNTAFGDYIKDTGVTTIYGIAYGSDDLTNAIDTLHLVKQQVKDITDFMINKYVKSFINDMENYDNLTNRVKNIYY
jgi:hypothetical protein